jgi:hypothetical protein
MALHDRRRREDEAAYARLLTDYIGVTADGQLPDGGPQGRCLREVMLGYLKTYEVVEGGNCLSCSRCVPNERFVASIDQRKRTVVKLGRVVEELLEQIEQQATQAPSAALLAELVAVVAEEQRAGRGLTGYMVGWTNRLLADAPDHRGALWTRLQLMISDLVPLDAEEFGRTLLALSEIQPSRDDAGRLLRLIDQGPDGALERSTLRIAEAAICRRLGDVDRETQALTAARKLAGARNRSRLSSVLNRLRTLWAPNGVVPNPAGFMEVTLELAAIADSPKASLDLYRTVMTPWDASRLREHVIDLRDRDRLDLVPLVVRVWLGIVAAPQDGRRRQDAASILEQVAASTLERLADDDLALIWPFLSEQNRPGLAIRAARQFLERGGADAHDTFDAIDAFSLAASMSEPVPSDVRQLTAERILRCLPALAQDTHIVDVLMSSAVGIDILGRAAAILPRQDVTTLTSWLNFIGLERLVRLGNTVIVGTMGAIAECVGRLSSSREAATRTRFLDVSTELRQRCEESGIARGDVRDIWRNVLLKCEDSLPGLLERCLTIRPARTALAHDAYEAMLACTPPSEIRGFLCRLVSNPSDQVPVRFLLGATFLDLLAEICPPPGKLATLDAGTLLRRLAQVHRTSRRSSPEGLRPHLADMTYAVIISQFAALYGSRRRCPDLEVRALCQGYRFDEAANVARQHPGLLVGPKRVPAGEFVKAAADSSANHRRTQRDSFEKDYLTILQRQ